MGHFYDSLSPDDGYVIFLCTPTSETTTPAGPQKIHWSTSELTNLYPILIPKTSAQAMAVLQLLHPNPSLHPTPSGGDLVVRR